MNDGRPTGHLWALIQEWMDGMLYPPSQRKLAKRLGVAPNTVTEWKYGDSFPSPEHLKALAAHIGVPYARALDAALADRGYDPPKREGAS